MDLNSLHFLRPAWLLALPLLLGFSLWLARRQARESDWSELIDADLLPELRLEQGGTRRTPWPWLALAWSVAVLALAGPSWEQDRSMAFRAPAAWVLVLDLSPSMAAADLTPNRVTRARYAIDDILGAAHDARVALVVFGDEAYPVTPLTDDIANLRTLLPPLAPDIMPTQGDQLAPGLEQAGALLRNTGAQHGNIVVISDGFADSASAFAAAARLHSQGITLDVLGVGTRQGAPVPLSGDSGFERDAQSQTRVAGLPVDTLQQLASSGGGRYADLAHLPELIAALQAHADTTHATTSSGVEVAHWRDGGVWFLPVLLLIAAAFARRGWL